MGLSIRDSARNYKLSASIALLAMVSGFSGCGGGAKSKPDASAMATVSGSVTNGGKPVTLNSNVVFMCSDKGATASGPIDSLGKFTLKEGDPNIGIPAGRYQVAIRPPDPPPTQVGSADYGKLMRAGKPADSPSAMQNAADRVTDIPSKFYTFETSGIALEVKAGPNTFDIDLAKLGG